ncbi:hypothetical protein DL96DRAFT_1583267 [Flagelloscypha sp. PMI_526]|nr:hypothetical protein DL96DRAFT_1583267 [Flagelloscypha sp. PMI_526]
MQPSSYEIEREVEALRDLRRRSTTPGALAIDPDLPIPSSPTSPGLEQVPELAGGSADVDDPLHLFWVPADVHPELAPAEFRQFLKEHARSPATHELHRSSSSSSTSGLGRKKSMLRNQYSPTESDRIDEDKPVVPLRRNRSSLYASQSPQLTIGDLQKLEELAEEASESHDATRLRSILRRSLSLNVSPAAAERMEDSADALDEGDSPIIVPPPGLILRRAARTKIRKPGLPGDGGGHRFGARRSSRSKTTGPDSLGERRLSDVSSEQGDSSSTEGFPLAVPRPRTVSHDGATTERPDSFSDVYDAYATDEDDEMLTHSVASSAPSNILHFTTEPEQDQRIPKEEHQSTSGVQPDLLEALGPIIHQPQPYPSQHYLSQPPPTGPSRTPSPQELASPAQEPPYRQQQPPRVNIPQQPQEPGFTPQLPSSYLPPSALNASQQASSQQGRKDKDKKGSIFGGKSSKKSGKEKEREGRSAEKSSGFFGSLFGGKKKHEDPTPVSSGAGREAAQALLGVSKSSKTRTPSPVPPGSPMAMGDNWSRFPIHVERAIYRLSHIKLANPRRPLYEQVLISNLMFWYLGVINNSKPAANAQGAGAQQDGDSTPNDEEAKQQKEKEERERAEQEARAEQERQEREREAAAAAASPKKNQNGKRTSLTKSAPGAAPTGGRRNEVPVKGPSYEMQHRVMEQEYGGYQHQQRGQYQQYSGAPQLTTPQPQSGLQLPDHFYYSSEQPQQQQHLPPGAMAPIDTSGWLQPSNSQSASASVSPPTSPSSKHRSRSPPNSSHGTYGGFGGDIVLGNASGRTPGRSQSATAISTTSNSGSAVPNGKLRKGQSAYAGSPQQYGGGGRSPIRGRDEEEDVPLAVWQQQRKR